MDENDTIRVWDISIRLFHWSLVVTFAVAYITGEVEGAVHASVGYIVLALLIYRLVWGLVGTKYARFTSFLFGPKETIDYLKGIMSGRVKRYLGHNPAGSVMIFLLLLSLFAAVWSGLELYAQEGKGPLATNVVNIISIAGANGEEDDREDEDDQNEFWEELHEVASHASLILIALHILGVFVSSALHKENLVKSMITGRKHVDSGSRDRST